MSMIKRFLQAESFGGVILVMAAFLALILNNSPFAHGYQSMLEMPLVMHVASWRLQGSILSLIDEGLMTIFFVLVGLELKRECVLGELAHPKRILLPAIAALGGMLVPALVYLFINHSNQLGARGWAVPVATDIAFALGVLSLFGKRVPRGLRLFLMTLAIFDDVGAICIIAFYYSHALSFVWMAFAAVCLLILLIFNRWRIQSLALYILVGIVLWFCVLQSGVHATVSGILFAFLIPIRDFAMKKSMLHRLEHILNPWVAYCILPLFALANAGVTLKSGFFPALFNPITLGVMFGLLIGKQLGVLSATWLLIKSGWSYLPAKTTWQEIYGVAVLCGIGFTMSLFLGTLAYEHDNPMNLIQIRFGVLLGSLLSGLIGAIVLRRAFKRKERGLQI